MTRRTALGLATATALVAATVTATAAPAPRVPRVLVFDQTLGFHHQSIEPAEVALRAMRGVTVEITKDPKALTTARLAKTDVVLWLSNTAGPGRVSPFTDAQERAYERWMRCGGGHVGVHAAVDSYDDKAFPAYVKANGAIFEGHPVTVTSAADDQDHENEGWGEPQHTLAVRDQRSPMTAPWRGKTSFQVNEELYRLDRDPAKVVTDYRPLLTHTSVDDPQGKAAVLLMGDYAKDAPIAWTGSYQHRNRTFYTNLGHSVRSWRDPAFLAHLKAGVLWTAGTRLDRGCLGR